MQVTVYEDCFDWDAEEKEKKKEIFPQDTKRWGEVEGGGEALLSRPREGKNKDRRESLIFFLALFTYD